MSYNEKRHKSRARSCKTPYQGTDRVFGKFQCQKCRQVWQSGYSWANQGQTCKKCKIIVYPYEQHPLEPGKSNGQVKNTRNHSPDTQSPKWDRKKCGKCRRLGYPCGQFQCGRRM